MNLLVVGASHRTAPVAALERLAVAAGRPRRTRSTGWSPSRTSARPSCCPPATGSRSTRRSPAFHGGLGDIGAVLADAGRARPPAELANHLYVHYDAAAVEHAFRVAAGLDSMVVGEAQILGQLRDAYHAAAERGHRRPAAARADAAGAAGRQAGARRDRHRPGRAERGHRRARRRRRPPAGGLAGRPALVVGAGSMGALAVATLARPGAGPLLGRPTAAPTGPQRLAEPLRRDRRRLRRPGRRAVHGGRRGLPRPRRPSRSSPRDRRRRARWRAPAGRPAAGPARPGRAARRRARRRRPARRHADRHRPRSAAALPTQPAAADAAAAEAIVATEVEAFLGLAARRRRRADRGRAARPRRRGRRRPSCAGWPSAAPT